VNVSKSIWPGRRNGVPPIVQPVGSGCPDEPRL
jgi:hypothetical protein